MNNRLAQMVCGRGLRPLVAVGVLGALLGGASAASGAGGDSFWYSSEPFWFFGKDAFDRVQVTLAPEYYYWHEEVNGQTFDKEEGFRMGLEFSYRESVESGWLWASRVKVYGGAVEYDGGLQGPGGTSTPLKSTTDYYGALMEARYGYRFIVGSQYSLDAMGGVTIDFWDRHLTGPGAYDEYWFPITVKAGVDLTPRTTGWIGSVAVKVPVFTYEDADLSRVGGPSINLYPQIMVSGDAELGYQFTRHLSASAFFDSYWFRQSPNVTVGNLIVNQPESKTFQVGAKLSYMF